MGMLVVVASTAVLSRANLDVEDVEGDVVSVELQHLVVKLFVPVCFSELHRRVKRVIAWHMVDTDLQLCVLGRLLQRHIRALKVLKLAQYPPRVFALLVSRLVGFCSDHLHNNKHTISMT